MGSAEKPDDGLWKREWKQSRYEMDVDSGCDSNVEKKKYRCYAVQCMYKQHIFGNCTTN